MARKKFDRNRTTKMDLMNFINLLLNDLGYQMFSPSLKSLRRQVCTQACPLESICNSITVMRSKEETNFLLKADLSRTRIVSKPTRCKSRLVTCARNQEAYFLLLDTQTLVNSTPSNLFEMSCNQISVDHSHIRNHF